MRVITPPTIEPASLSDIKIQLGIKTVDTSSDSTITRRITQAREWVENYMHRALVRQCQEITFDYFPSEIVIPYPTTTSITTLRYVDLDGVLQTISPSEYDLDTYGTLAAVRPVWGGCWPAARAERNSIRVQYISGYGTTAIASAKTITAATNAFPGVFTSAAHGFIDGDIVLISTTGMSEVDGYPFAVYAKATDTFQLSSLSRDRGIDTTDMGVFTAGTAQKVTLDVPSEIKDALMLIVGHWMNHQRQIEGGMNMTRIPVSITQKLDPYAVEITL